MDKSPSPVKYFFLSVGWNVNRVWEMGGLWDEGSWRRPPYIEKVNLGIVEQGEQFWLYQVEEAVLMVEVQPDRANIAPNSPFGKVLLKRLMSAGQVLERLQNADQLFNAATLKSSP